MRLRLLPAILPAVTAAAQCPIVDRGSPTDGATTITVLEEVGPCTDHPLFEGWQCMIVRSDANDNGVHYQIDVRWNRVDQPVRGSFTWLKGGSSTESIRLSTPLAVEVQDALDAVDQVRTIELRFLGNGTATPPRNGFVNISSVYADVLELLVTEGRAAGVVGHYGNSGGSMMGANALAYHRAGELLDGIVLGGGPFWSDLEQVCADPGSPIFADLHLRETTDDWNWADFAGRSWCADMAPRAQPPYTCRSTLGAEADAVYESTIVRVIVGVNDGFNPWMTASALAWFEQIGALDKTFDQPDAPHFVVASEAGAAALLERIRDIVDAYDAPADVNGDGLVDVDDLVAVVIAWGPCPDPPAPCPADVDGSGTVDVGDLVAVVLAWS